MQSLMYSIKQLKLLYYLFKMSKNLLKASSMMKERIAVLPTIQEMTTKGDSKQWIKKHANRLIVSIVLIQQENVSGIQYLECVTHNQGHKQFKNKINRDGGNGTLAVKMNSAFACLMRIVWLIWLVVLSARPSTMERLQIFKFKNKIIAHRQVNKFQETTFVAGA